MEFFPHGDLYECVKAPMEEEEVQIISHQVLEALAFMHQKKFTHRDVKPSVRTPHISNPYLTDFTECLRCVEVFSLVGQARRLWCLETCEE